MGEYRGACALRPFLRYVCARLQKDTEQVSYCAYMTDGLRALAGGSQWLRWYEVMHPARRIDTRTGEQIRDEIQTRLKGMWGGGSE